MKAMVEDATEEVGEYQIPALFHYLNQPFPIQQLDVASGQ